MTLNIKEQKRLLVMNEVTAGLMTGQQAASMLGTVLMQRRRLVASYRPQEAAAIAQGSRERVSDNKMDQSVEEEIFRLSLCGNGRFLGHCLLCSNVSPHVMRF